MKFHPEILTPLATDLLPRLEDSRLLEDFYLVGGTALSLYLGHRISIDFDFFTQRPFKASAIERFRSLSQGEFEVLNQANGSLEFSLDGVKVFLWENYYKLTAPLNKFGKLNIVDPVDIGLFKLLALEGRANWKDYVDLYFFHKQVLPLSELLKRFNEVYPKDKLNNYALLKVVLNREEVDKSPRPKMLTTIDYEEVWDLVSTELMREFAAKLS